MAPQTTMKYDSAVWLNEHRFFPRLFVTGYLAFYAYAWVLVFKWFTAFDWNALPTDQIVGSAAVAAVAGFPAVILTAMGKMLKELLTSYWNGTPKSADQ